jgi:hypothetical protein
MLHVQRWETIVVSFHLDTLSPCSSSYPFSLPALSLTTVSGGHTKIHLNYSRTLLSYHAFLSQRSSRSSSTFGWNWDLLVLGLSPLHTRYVGPFDDLTDSLKNKLNPGYSITFGYFGDNNVMAIRNSYTLKKKLFGQIISIKSMWQMVLQVPICS